MRRRGKASIVHEVKLSLKEINYIGNSKKAYREKSLKGIHSYKQWQHTLSASQNFVKWVREEFEIKYIKDLRLLHYEAYISYLEKKNRSTGHRRNVETALRLLQEGVVLYLKKKGIESNRFVSEKRLTNWRELEKPINRSYSEDEYLQIINHLSQESKKAVKLMWSLGIRLKECANIRVEHFQQNPSSRKWMLIIEDGEGITKGGRYRKTPVSMEFGQELEGMLKNKDMEDKIVEIKYATIRHAVYTACLKAGISQNRRGCHGFRHSYVRNRMKFELEKASIEKEAYTVLEKIFNNRELNRPTDYGIHGERKLYIYEKVKEIMNKIHEEIGHGHNRWDLAEIYMKGDIEDGGDGTTKDRK